MLGKEMKDFDSSILCAPSKFQRQLVYLNLELKNTFSTENCPTFLWKDEGKELSPLIFWKHALLAELPCLVPWNNLGQGNI